MCVICALWKWASFFWGGHPHTTVYMYAMILHLPAVLQPWSVRNCRPTLKEAWLVLRSKLATVEPLYNVLLTDTIGNKHFVHYRETGVPNSGASGIFPVGVVCIIWLLSCVFRTLLRCTLAGKAKWRLVLRVAALIYVKLLTIQERRWTILLKRSTSVRY